MYSLLELGLGGGDFSILKPVSYAQLKIKNWTSCIQDRNKWKLYVEKAKTFKASKEEEELCTRCYNYYHTADG